MRRVLLLTCLLLAACGSAPLGKTAASSTAKATQSPTTSPSFASSSSSPSSAEGLACRLPVAVGSTPGFVTFPGGSFAADPQPKMISPPENPYGPSLIYDRPFTRWLGVP